MRAESDFILSPMVVSSCASSLCASGCEAMVSDSACLRIAVECWWSSNAFSMPGFVVITCMPKASMARTGSYSSTNVSSTLRSWYLLLASSHKASREVPDGTNPSDWYTE